MFPFTRLKWAEMRPLAHNLIARVQDGHAHGRFALPLVEFVRVFAPQAGADELTKIAARGAIEFTPDATQGGVFSLAPGEPATLDLRREGFVLRVPARMSGRYELYPGGFLVAFDEGEELEGCKRLLLLVCHRIASVNVSTERVYARAVTSRVFDLLVEFG